MVDDPNPPHLPQGVPPKMPDKDALSYCVKGCRMGRLLKDKPETLRDLDDLLIQRTKHETIIEWLANKHNLPGLKKWDLSRHANKCLIKEREEKVPVVSEAKTPKDPEQKAITDAEYRPVRLMVPQVQFDRAKKMDVNGDVSETVQMLKSERDRIWLATRENDPTKAQAAVRLWKDICAELRLWEELAKSIQVSSSSSQEMPMGEFYANLNATRKKDDKKDDTNKSTGSSQ